MPALPSGGGTSGHAPTRRQAGVQIVSSLSQSRGSEIAILLKAAGMNVSASRHESLTEELLALAESAKGIVNVVSSRPDCVPIVVFRPFSPDEDGCDEHRS